MQAMVKSQYEELFDAMPSPALLTYGNVDIPALWPDYLRDGHRVVDAEVVEVGRHALGIRRRRSREPDAHALRDPRGGVRRRRSPPSAPVDVLFTHIPPALPELTYDVVARRFEVGSQALLEYVRDVQPRYHLFGHVHQPLASQDAGRANRVHQRGALPRHAADPSSSTFPAAGKRSGRDGSLRPMADQTESSIVINASPAAIMDVIADLAAYPQWSDGIKEVTVLALYEDDNRPADARFNLSSGAIKDIYELEYDWDGDDKVSWTLTKGDMLTAMDGVYELTPNGDGTHHGALPPRRGRQDPDDRDDQAQGREGHRRYRPEGV